MYNSSLNQALKKLKELEIYCGNSIKILGLNGWVFEQTIQYCLKQELAIYGIKIYISEQFKLSGKIVIDLCLNDKILIEIKAGGLFESTDKSRAKFEKYKRLVIEYNLNYLYISKSETYPPYVSVIREVFGNNNSFFLDQGEWSAFINRIVDF